MPDTYVALHHWSKFQTNLTTFQWVTSKKTAQKQPKIVPLLVWKHLKFQNWRTTDQKYMKLGPDMYQYVPAEYLQYNKNEDVNEWAGGEGNQKNT